jgi:hypothetical protein
MSLPNINDWIARLDHASCPSAGPGSPGICWRAPPRAHALMGVRKRFHRTMIGSALALGVIGDPPHHRAARHRAAN